MRAFSFCLSVLLTINSFCTQTGTFLCISYLRVNEWKLGEKRDNCTLYTFLHETFHLQLVFEKSTGKIFSLMVVSRHQRVNKEGIVLFFFNTRCARKASTWWTAFILFLLEFEFLKLRCASTCTGKGKKPQNLNHVPLLAKLLT